MSSSRKKTWLAFASTGITPVILTALSTLLLATAIQLSVQQGPVLFGKSLGNIAAGVIEYYPELAFGEAAKLLGVVALVLFIICYVARDATAFLTRRKLKSPRLSIFAILISSYGLFLIGSALKYPAIYENFMGANVARIIFFLGHVASPPVFQWTASTILAGVLFLAAMQNIRAIIAVAITLVGLAFYMKGERLEQLTSLFAPPIIHKNTSIPASHIYLIAIDSLRTDRAANTNLTPTITSLINDPQTVSFQEHYIGVPRTFPSWVELIQGKYSGKTGIRHMFPGFTVRDHEFTGLVTDLKARGYHTAVVSDFAGDIFPRFSAGFDDVLAPAFTLGNMIRQSVDLMFPLYLPLVTSDAGTKIFRALKTSAAFSDPAHLVDNARQVRKTVVHSEENDSLFLALFFSTAHFPYAAPHPYYAKYSDPKYSGPFLFQKNPALDGDESALTPADKAQVNHLYDGAIRGIDDALGDFFEELKQEGLWESSTIILTADHGEDLFDYDNLQGHGEHLRGTNVLRVPLFVKLPKQIPLRQKQVDFITRMIDLAPTITGIAAASNKKNEKDAPKYDGQDLIPWLSRQTEKIDTNLPAYSETEIWFSRTGKTFFQKQRLDYPGIAGLLAFDSGHGGEIALNPKFENILVTSRHRMLQDNQWKLIYIPTSSGVQYELYDWKKDPNNRVDLAKDHPAELHAMKAKLLPFIRELEQHSLVLSDYVIPQ